ncbi:hypothetical protein [Serratia fonticola]|uniref:hypothetical protein n=1 Tax=Serratia fonticola TaxID=47917 RepID=UPI0027EF69F4|nr:hypothetical protein [Serratia fonticola]MDQ7212540.1 hypothetical protein [Serratia fonticola]HBE9082719.1 hypothetical protein [Serratia fonticola]HBE9093272.1 hypothetical protein [Serratia fonticola]HBE9155569.1 hypothetical protein [Serratia fonticola]
MAKLIKVSENDSYDADYIVGVAVSGNDYLNVMLADGSIISADIGYGESAYQAKRRLEAEINAAKTNGGA